MEPAEQRSLFDQWLKEYAAMLQHVANGFASGADRDDLLQELLVALWEAIPRFREVAKPSTFVFRVCHNAALTWKRTEKRRVSRIEVSDTVGDHPAAEPNRDAAALGYLYEAIRSLRPVDRSILLLHLDGQSYSEIGEIHGMTETNVGARLTRVRQQLTDNLEAITHELR